MTHPSTLPYDQDTDEDTGAAFASTGFDTEPTWAPRRPAVDQTKWDTHVPGTAGWLVAHFQTRAVRDGVDPAAVLDYCERLGIDPYSHRWIAHAVTAVRCFELDTVTS